MFVKLIIKYNFMVGEKIFGWFGAAGGALAIIGSLDPIDGYGLVGGIVFLASGVTILQLVKKVEKLEK